MANSISAKLKSAQIAPRVPLLVGATPVQRLEGLSRALQVEVFVKRDDFESYGIAGSKARKLEYVLGQASALNARNLITMGPAESNTCRALAIAAAKVGLQAHLVIANDRPAHLSGNMLLSAVSGAKFHWVGARDHADLQFQLHAIFEQLRDADPCALMVPAGCSSPVGILGMVRAYDELAGQMEANGGIGTIVHASATGGLWAGLAAGAVMSESPLPLAINVASLYQDVSLEYVSLLREVLSLLGEPLPALEWQDYIFDHPDYRAYGDISARDMALLRALLVGDGIVLDPIYTVKAVRALFDLRSSGRLVEPVVLWHSGGLQNFADERIQREISRCLDVSSASNFPGW